MALGVWHVGYHLAFRVLSSRPLITVEPKKGYKAEVDQSEAAQTTQMVGSLAGDLVRS